MIGEIDNHKVNRILLDPGSSVSLLPLRLLKGNQPKQKLRPKCSPKRQKDLSQPRNYRAGRNHQQFPLQRMTKVQKGKLFSMQQATQNQKRFLFLDDTSSDAGSSVLRVGSESDSEREARVYDTHFCFVSTPGKTLTLSFQRGARGPNPCFCFPLGKIAYHVLLFMSFPFFHRREGREVKV